MSEIPDPSHDQEQPFTPVELERSAEAQHLSEFVLAGETLPVTYVESQVVKEGVTCDIYTIDGDESRDLAIVHVAKGFKTPNKEVVDGNTTVEGLVSGDGMLTVRSPDGSARAYDFDGDDEHEAVEVKVGETMQWSANRDSDLTFYEVCDPPYQDGRFKDLPDLSFSPTPPDAKIGNHPISGFNLNAHGQNPDWIPNGPKGWQAGGEGPDLTPSPELQKELTDRKVVTNPDTGQGFGYIELNRNAGPSNEALVSLLPFSPDTQHPNANYELEQIALQSGRRTIAYDSLSTGASDKLTTDQKDAMERGDFSLVARSILGAMKAQGLDKIELEGFSLGSRVAMAVAADASEFGIKVNNLIVFEPPGFADRSLAEMYKHVLIDEGIKNLPAYTKLAKDERGKESIDSRLDTIKLFTRLAITDIRGNAVSYPKGLGKETGLEDLIRALETQPELKLTIISGGSSAIAPRDNINAAYETLAEDYPGQVGMVRLPGDTHAITTGFARRIGWHVGRILKRKP